MLTICEKVYASGMSDSQRLQDAVSLSFESEGSLGGNLQSYKDAFPWADLAALELNQRLAATEAARRAAMIHRWSAIGLSKATGQYTVLRSLYFVPGHKMTQSEIGRSMGVTSSNVTRLIDGLEHDGFVRRTADHVDRRVTFVELTPDGRELSQRIVPAVVQFSMDVAKIFSPEELQTLLSLLSRLQAHAESLDDGGGG